MGKLTLCAKGHPKRTETCAWCDGYHIPDLVVALARIPQPVVGRIGRGDDMKALFLFPKMGVKVPVFINDIMNGFTPEEPNEGYWCFYAKVEGFYHIGVSEKPWEWRKGKVATFLHAEYYHDREAAEKRKTELLWTHRRHASLNGQFFNEDILGKDK